MSRSFLKKKLIQDEAIRQAVKKASNLGPHAAETPAALGCPAGDGAERYEPGT